VKDGKQIDKSLAVQVKDREQTGHVLARTRTRSGENSTERRGSEVKGTRRDKEKYGR
jgi:hypothetical protein